MNNDQNTQLNDTIIKNAISTYLMIFINGAFFISKDKNIKHPFVMQHTKNAIPTHLLFVFVYVVFIHFGLLSNINFENIFLNKIIAGTLFILLFLWLLRGIYLANKGIYPSNSKIFEDIKFNFSNKNDTVGVTKEVSEEKEKLTIILSLIPFISPFIYSKTDANIQNTSKICLYVTFLIISLIVSGKTDIATLFTLLYIIFIAFSSLFLFTKSEIFIVSLQKIGFPYEIYSYSKDFFAYLENYFSENFKNWTQFIQEKNEIKKQKEEAEKVEIQNLSPFTMNTTLIYIPLVHLLTLRKIESNMKNQIINSLGFYVLFFIVLGICSVVNTYEILMLMVIPYITILARKKDIHYKSPLFYDIGNMIYILFLKSNTLYAKAKELQKKEEIVQMKVEEK